MRTTVEITDRQRSRLLQIAASRGQKGFSSLVQEAIDLYLKVRGEKAARARRALKLRGILAGDEADDLASRVAEVHGGWR